jgi:hypothetical protein
MPCTLLFIALLLGGLLLGLALLLTGVSGHGLFQDLKDFLVLNLLVGLVLLEVQSGRGTKLGNTVLGNGESCEVSGNGGVVLVTNELVLAEDVSSNTLNDTRLGVTLILKLSQAEGEDTELLLDLVEDLARSRSLQTVSLVGAAVESSTLVESLDLSGAQTDTDLNTPNFTNLGNTLTLGALGRGKDNLLAAFDLVVVEKPRSGALDNVDVVGLGNLLQEAGDLGLCGSLLGGSLGLLLIRALSQETRGDHQSQKDLVDVVVSEDQVGSSASDLLASLVFGSGDHSVTDDGTEAIDLGTKLDLDGLTILNLGAGLSLVGGKRSVGSDVGRGGDGSGVGETLVDLLSSVDLGNLFLDELVSLLADIDNLGARNNELGNLSKNLLRDLSSGLVLCEGIWVSQSVI